MIKTNKRHVIPLTEPALHILQQWREKREGCRYVFNLVKEILDLDDAEALYKARNNDEKTYWMHGKIDFFPGADLDRLFNI